MQRAILAQQRVRWLSFIERKTNEIRRSKPGKFAFEQGVIGSNGVKCSAARTKDASRNETHKRFRVCVLLL